MVKRYCFLLMLLFNSCSDRMRNEKAQTPPDSIVITIHGSDLKGFADNVRDAGNEPGETKSKISS